ncbi:MAG: nucleoside phosphorylase, partial [Phaeodactylibacter sp.]|nr:nucleoside phosphorylase [Phaeodactylibacter sp.]
REFLTHTGTLGNQRLTVTSTGIGPDNIDIVLNELDALANIDLQTRAIKAKKRQLRFIRVGTSGSLQPELDVDQFLVSHAAIGLDNLLHYYADSQAHQDTALANSFNALIQEVAPGLPQAYAFGAAPALTRQFAGPHAAGITLTAPGFYGPQGRALRLQSRLHEHFFERIRQFQWAGLKVTNFEMETAALLGLSRLLGHEAIAVNAILANRPKGTFSDQAHQSVDHLIEWTLEKLQ